MKKKKVLITGANEFIDSHLTERLLDRRYDVRASVYHNSFNNWGRLNTVIPTIITQLLTGKKDIKLGSLTPIRNFTM